jgi:lysine-N-methylase
MTLPIRILKIGERWDCHSCAVCCRGSVIQLDEEEVRRLEEQAWHQSPDYRGVRILVRQGLWKKRYRLAKRADGSCVFLMSDGKCRIHCDHGAEAKPLICRMFPFQIVPLAEFACLTLRRSCPSAAAGRGRNIEEHRRSMCDLVQTGRMAPKRTKPPAVVRGHVPSWKDTLRVAEVIERLMLDERFPIVRRLVHGLKFCDLLAECRLHKCSSGDLAELLKMLEGSAPEGAGELFQSRPSPGNTARVLFRQTALEYLRLHPKFVVEESRSARRQLISASVAMVRGKGTLPPIHPDFPATTFEALERPLGHLPQDVLEPLTVYFEASAASKQYAILGRRGWSLVDSFRALAMSHAMALWMLRLVAADRSPEVEDMIGVVAAIDRGQGFAPLAGRRHRRRVAAVARLGDLAPLVAWYAR